MSYVQDALHQFSVNRIEEQRRLANTATTNTLIPPRNTGFCESCQRHKPAPKKRNKGWPCDECRAVA